MNKYLNIITIKILNITLSFQIGNPLWYIHEYKNIRREGE